MTASQRIEKLAEHFHTNVKALSELCGYDRPQAFYDILKGKTRNISPTMCDRILSVLPSVNRVWLLTGEGSITNDAQQAARDAAQKDRDTVKTVPLVHMTAIAGPIKSYYESGEYLDNCERIPSPTPKAELAIPITGDSMEPSFPSGSIAFVARINEASFIPWGHTMVLDTENGVFIKNVYPDDSDQAFIWAESINPRYPRMRIPKDVVYSMYRVLSVMKSFVAM